MEMKTEWERLQKDAERESSENMRRAWHNAFCKDVDKLQPYNSKAFLDYVNFVDRLSRSICGKQKTAHP
jgi:hypothetical protein